MSGTSLEIILDSQIHSQAEGHEESSGKPQLFRDMLNRCCMKFIGRSMCVNIGDNHILKGNV